MSFAIPLTIDAASQIILKSLGKPAGGFESLRLVSSFNILLSPLASAYA